MRFAFSHTTQGGASLQFCLKIIFQFKLSNCIYRTPLGYVKHVTFPSKSKFNLISISQFCFWSEPVIIVTWSSLTYFRFISYYLWSKHFIIFGFFLPSTLCFLCLGGLQRQVEASCDILNKKNERNIIKGTYFFVFTVHLKCILWKKFFPYTWLKTPTVLFSTHSSVIKLHWWS